MTFRSREQITAECGTSARRSPAAAFRCGRSARSTRGCSIQLQWSRTSPRAAAFRCSRSALADSSYAEFAARRACSDSYVQRIRYDVGSHSRTWLDILVLDEKSSRTSALRTEMVRSTDTSRPPNGPPKLGCVRPPDLAVRCTDPGVRTADLAHIAGATQWTRCPPFRPRERRVIRQAPEL